MIAGMGVGRILERGFYSGGWDYGEGVLLGHGMGKMTATAEQWPAKPRGWSGEGLPLQVEGLSDPLRLVELLPCEEFYFHGL
jgi:hypothetical protein